IFQRRLMDFFDEITTRNVNEIYPNKKTFIEKLSGKQKLKIYLGIDPSSPKIHLGNAIALRKLREFQNLGHQVILLIGDFTGMIGDPTDRNAIRKPLTKEEVLSNANNYKKQAEKILNFSGKNPAEILYNSHWLAKLTFEEIIKLAAHFTVKQMLERDMFQKRLAENKPIGLHEFLYPLMQGYDSVAMNIDVEIGGSDQTFNMLIGRQLMQNLNGKEKFVITLPLLEGTDGRKMSKSFNNSIDLTDSPTDIYGKIMSLKDELILKYFEMTTDIALGELKSIRNIIKSENPINTKKKLAFTLVEQYYSTADAQIAQEEFEQVVQKKDLPSQIEEIEFPRKILPKPFHFFLTETGMCESISDAVRLASQGAVYFDENRVENCREMFNTKKTNITIKAGKRNFKKLIFT
ncbi:MAG: tyrosine--tRNA ligase, partial [Candidatus Magasanikbacteria bacterium]|nr:tyrosine--tRNA ligase [Candidatus Magasanikbacteria bacterium]